MTLAISLPHYGSIIFFFSPLSLLQLAFYSRAVVWSSLGPQQLNLTRRDCSSNHYLFFMLVPAAHNGWPRAEDWVRSKVGRQFWACYHFHCISACHSLCVCSTIEACVQTACLSLSSQFVFPPCHSWQLTRPMWNNSDIPGKSSDFSDDD